MAIQLAPITIVIERNVARVRTDKGRRRAVRGRERETEKKMSVYLYRHTDVSLYRGQKKVLLGGDRYYWRTVDADRREGSH